MASYEEVVRRFLHFAGDIAVDQLTTALIKDYKRDLMARVSPGTTWNALITMRMFCAWCVSEGYLDHNPALAVTHPRVEPPNPDPLTRAEIAALLRALDTPHRTHKATWPRNRRAMCLMLYAGLRIAEVAGLETRDLDLDRRTITSRRDMVKGGKPRGVPISAELLIEREPLRHYRPSWAVGDQGDARGKRGRPLTVKSLAHPADGLPRDKERMPGAWRLGWSLPHSCLIASRQSSAAISAVSRSLVPGWRGTCSGVGPATGCGVGGPRAAGVLVDARAGLVLDRSYAAPSALLVTGRGYGDIR